MLLNSPDSHVVNDHLPRNKAPTQDYAEGCCNLPALHCSYNSFKSTLVKILRDLQLHLVEKME